ncbi:MAG: hypothetical protein AB1813_22230, partial [Verrucomicrobiota bacterium]
TPDLRAPSQFTLTVLQPLQNDTQPLQNVLQRTEFQSLQTSEQKKQRKTKKEQITAGAECEEIYDQFPLKAGKPTALRAIAKCLKEFSADYLMERTKAFAKARNGDLKFCPYPATWFNQRRFQDDPSTWVPRAATNKQTPDHESGF